jgi:glycosyltransferase involved in cell wall biosynthesis
MKNIAVNALTVDHHPSGGKTYFVNLLSNLTALSGAQYHYYILVVGEYSGVFSESLKYNNASLIKFPKFVNRPIPRILVEQLYLPLWLWGRKIDLLFAARNIMPILTKCPTVVGVLSMHLNYEKLDLPFWRRIYGNSILDASARKAKAYIAISKYAGETYIRKFGLPEERLYVAPLSFNPRQSHSSSQNFHLPFTDPYLLFVSTLFPHKQVDFLIRVFRIVSDQRPDLKLAIIGRDVNGATASLKQLAESLGIQNQVYFSGAIPDEELEQWYTNALVFVFPSLIEGFGLSVLEAMAFGIPVVASNRTSIPEVVGDAGILLEPTDEQEWAQAILSILGNKEEYSRYSALSKERTRLFSWNITAEVVLKCFNQILRS